jgi:hypothetical protein
VANGYIAPFAEAGVAFGYSEREQQRREVVASYRRAMRSWFAVLGDQRLRSWFAALPMDERVAIGHRLLRLTSSTPDHDAGLAERFGHWERGGALRASEWALVAIVRQAPVRAMPSWRRGGERSGRSLARAGQPWRPKLRRLRAAVAPAGHDRNRRRLRSTGSTLDRRALPSSCRTNHRGH